MRNLLAKKVLATKDEKELAKLPRLAEAYARRTMNAAERKEDSSSSSCATASATAAVVSVRDIRGNRLELKDAAARFRNDGHWPANGRYGYPPTPEQHRLGGYETARHELGAEATRPSFSSTT